MHVTKVPTPTFGVANHIALLSSLSQHETLNPVRKYFLGTFPVYRLTTHIDHCTNPHDPVLNMPEKHSMFNATTVTMITKKSCNLIAAATPEQLRV